MTPIIKGNSMIIWGTVAFDATFRDLKNNNCVCNFLVNYAMSQGEKGNRRYVGMNCTAWNDIARYCAGLEQGDTVMCCGEVTADSYRSQKSGKDEFLLTVNFISVVPKAETVELTEEEAEPPTEDTFTEITDEDDSELPF